MLERARRITPERIGRFVVGLGAATTSSLLVCWIPMSLLGRAIVFAGSGVFGAVLAAWAANASTPARAVGKSMLAGGIQANVAGSALAILAMVVDTALGIAPDGVRLSSAAALGVATLIVGTLVGAFVGLAFGFVPAFVAASRIGRTHATADRIMIAASAWLVGIGIAHRYLVVSATSASVAPLERTLLDATWAVPIAVALVTSVFALARTSLRRAFVRRVRAGRDARYRVVEIEAASLADDALPAVGGVAREACRAAIVRVREPAFAGYREAAEPDLEPRAVALLP